MVLDWENGYRHRADYRLLTRLEMAVWRLFCFRLRPATFLTSAASLASSLSDASIFAGVLRKGSRGPIGLGGGEVENSGAEATRPPINGSVMIDDIVKQQNKRKGEKRKEIFSVLCLWKY